jgi:hypothetical protein
VLENLKRHEREARRLFAATMGPARSDAGESTGGSSSSPAPSSFATGAERNGGLRTIVSRNAERTALAAAALFVLLLDLKAGGAEIEGVVFEDRVFVRDVPLVVAHVGLLRRRELSRRLVRRCPEAPRARLFLVDRRKGVRSHGEEILARNVSSEEMARLHTRLDRIASFYPMFGPEIASRSPTFRAWARSSPGTARSSELWKAPTSRRHTSRSGSGASR